MNVPRSTSREATNWSFAQPVSGLSTEFDMHSTGKQLNLFGGAMHSTTSRACHHRRNDLISESPTRSS